MRPIRVPGANRDAAGSPLFAGFIIDDAGGGYYLPRLMVDGRDGLLATAAERAAFAPQYEVAHQLYTGETGDYLLLKRENAWILQSKGLGDRWVARGIAPWPTRSDSYLLGDLDHDGGRENRAVNRRVPIAPPPAGMAS